MGRVDPSQTKASTSSPVAATLTEPSVLVVILNWNLAHETIRCVESCLATTYARARFLLIDNGSSASVVAELRRWADSREKSWREVSGRESETPGDGELAIMFHSTNTGYAGGNNLGLECALAWGMDWVLVLNNDATIPPGYISGLVASGISSPTAGLIGSRQSYPQQLRLRPSCGVRLSYSLGAYPFRKYPCGSGTKPANFAPGNSVLIRVEMLRQIGLFDERYFLYSEDIDLSYRALSAGWLILINRDVTAEQGISASLGGRRSPTYYYYLVRNTLLFLSERLPGYQRRVSMAVFLALISVRAALWFITGKRSQLAAARLGAQHFRHGRFGRAPSL